MKISDCIKELERAKSKHGDLEVRCYPYDGQIDSSPICLEIWERLGVKVLGIDAYNEETT